MENVKIFEHNETAYENVKSFFAGNYSGNTSVPNTSVPNTSMPNRCCVIHPTGTGKSYIALQLIDDNKDKSILYVTSYSVNLALFQESVQENIGDVPSLICSIYASLRPEDFPQFDYIILDEFHRAGAPEWQKAVEAILANNLNAKILGLSATPIRHLDNNRNMAVEMFGGNVVSEITLHEALMSELLPIPFYTTCVYSYEEDLQRAEALLDRTRRNAESRRMAFAALNKAKRILENSEGLDKVFQQKMKYPHGKYIVFCRNTEHLLQMETESLTWFSWQAEDPHIYQVMSDLGAEADSQLEAFSQDEDGSVLRLLFVIDMLNEGTHLDDVDGVIMLRPTESLNVYYQQMGRALTVSGTKKPQIFDIVNNASSLTPVQEFWQGFISEVSNDGNPFDGTFEVWARDIEIQKCLWEFRDALNTKSWDEMYQLCAAYYKEHGTLTMPKNYIVDGSNLSLWLVAQRQHKNELSEEQINKLDALEIVWNTVIEKWEDCYQEAAEFYRQHGHIKTRRGVDRIHGWVYKQRRRLGAEKCTLAEEQIKRLHEIGIYPVENSWEKAYAELERYYARHGDINVPEDYATDGGVNLYRWISSQRRHRAGIDSPPLTQNQIDRLDKIGMKWEYKKATAHISWDNAYEICRRYYEEHGNLDIPINYIDYDYNIGIWIRNQKAKERSGRIPQEQRDKLEKIGVVWGKTANERKWDEVYAVAVSYYNEFGNLDVKSDQEYMGIKLHTWIVYQRQKRKGKGAPLSKEQIDKLDAIHMVWNPKESDADQVQAGHKLEKTEIKKDALSWDQYYEVAVKYYNEHGSLDMKNSTEVDGVKLGRWLALQKRRKRGSADRMLADEQIEKLDALGINWEVKRQIHNLSWNDVYNVCEKYYQEHGDLRVPMNYKIDGYNVNSWLVRQRERYFKHGSTPLTDEQIEKLNRIGMVWDYKAEEWEKNFSIASDYYHEHGDLNVKYNCDYGGIKLGVWIITQRRRLNGKDGNMLTEEQVDRLNSIGMIWNPIAAQWEDKFAVRKSIIRSLVILMFHMVLSSKAASLAPGLEHRCRGRRAIRM